MSRYSSAYKPLRNYIAQFNLTASLQYIWLYFRHVLSGGPLPPDFAAPGRIEIKSNVHPWELSLLARELIMHASNSAQKTLGSYAELIGAINRIRAFENEIAAGELRETTVFGELHRIAHRQFPWQHQRDMSVLVRYLKIFGERDVDAVLTRETGLTMTQLYFMGLAVSGHLLKYSGINTQQDYSGFGIPAQAREVFFNKMAVDIESLRLRTKDEQRYDGRWAYTWNPLEATPLVSLDPKSPNLVHCPIPTFLLRRIAQGVFYDLIKADDFDNRYGRAFENYVGEVLREVCKGIRYTLTGEKPYKVGQQQRHGVDWILEDGTANLFVECKTKRLVQNAKMVAEGDVLDAQFDVMASAIIQLYRNITDAIEDRTEWKPNSLPVYPLVVTLEEWYLFSPVMTEALRSRVKDRLVRAEIDARIVDEMPYTIASVDELEIVGQLIKSVGINSIFLAKTKAANRDLLLRSCATISFPSELSHARNFLFEADLDRLIPNTAECWIRNLRPGA